MQLGIKTKINNTSVTKTSFNISSVYGYNIIMSVTTEKVSNFQDLSEVDQYSSVHFYTQQSDMSNDFKASDSLLDQTSFSLQGSEVQISDIWFFRAICV